MINLWIANTIVSDHFWGLKEACNTYRKCLAASAVRRWEAEEHYYRAFERHSVPGFQSGAPVDVAKEFEVLRAVREEAAGLVQVLNATLAGVSEDSYATRNDLHRSIRFFSGFNSQVQSVEVGGLVDLRIELTAYGYDPEDAASAHSCGLEYVPEEEVQARDYEARVERLAPMIEKLRRLGIGVSTGITFLDPEIDQDDDGYPSIPEAPSFCQALDFLDYHGIECRPSQLEGHFEVQRMSRNLGGGFTKTWETLPLTGQAIAARLGF